MRPCEHCRVLTPANELRDGYCFRSECREEAPPLPPLDRAVAEVMGVSACRRAGLHAIPRPCKSPNVYAPSPCPSCLETATKRFFGMGTVKAERYGGARRWEETFSEQDAIDLDRYYRMDIVPKWERSTFGQMCQHLASSTRVNPKDLAEFRRRTTPQWPPKGSPPDRYYEVEVDGKLVQVTVLLPQRAPESWASEVVRARGSSRGGQKADYDEGDLATYFDRRCREQRVVATLSKLRSLHCDVLEARYTPGQEQAGSQLGALASVGLLTEAAKRARKKRSESGVGETIRDTLLYLSNASQSTTIPGAERRAAKERLAEIESEAEKMLDAAEKAYARAALKTGVNE